MKSVTLNFDGIFRICLGDPDPAIRVKGIEGLWECEDCALIRPLIEMLSGDSDEAVRAAAARALGKFSLLAEFRKVPLRYVPKISEALFSVIDNPQERLGLRCCAIEAVAPLSLPRVKEAIHHAYRSREFNLKISALRAMGRNADPNWLPMLLKELASPHLEMRVEAVKACGELGERNIVPYLSKLITDAPGQVRCAAIEALGKIIKVPE
jgi:HEAT repeat protein